MATEILMPKLGLTMTEGTVDAWYKEEGDTVEKGEMIASISSEKLTHDVESPVDGILQQIVVDEGGEVPVQQPIAYVAAADAADVPQTIEAAAPVKEEPEKQAQRIFITPSARRLARMKGIDYTRITGTGGRGRITRQDVEKYAAAGTSDTEAAVLATPVMEPGKGLTGMRQTIAKRMWQSLQQTAPVTLHRKADVSQLMAFRKEIKENAEIVLADGQLSINTLLTRAVVLALKEHPQMNAWYFNGEYQTVEEIHIGIAVNMADGLVVPVIKHAEHMTLTDIGQTFRHIVDKTQRGDFSGNLLGGSTFTISNMGQTNIEYFTPIINTPEIGILGVGTLATDLALAEDGSLVTKQKLPLSLTFDHQVIDGVPAAEFLEKICDLLAHPYALVL